MAGWIPEDLRRDLATLEPEVELTETLERVPHLVVLGEGAPFAARDLRSSAGEFDEPVPVIALRPDPGADLDRALECLPRGDLLRLALRLARMRRRLMPGLFLQRLEYEFSRALRFRHPVGLILLRLDARERLTEVYGVDALASFAALLEGALRRGLREVDLLFRIAEDEIATILPETPASGAAAVAERFLTQTAGLVFKPAAAGARAILPMKATSSIGVADGPREGVASHEDLLVRARASLSRAGDAGGGRVAVDRLLPS